MLALFLMLLVSAPPPSPPERDRHAAAFRLWQEHPPPEQWKQSSIDIALYQSAATALMEAGVRRGRRRWQSRHDALSERLRSQIPADRTALDHAALACAAEDLAYQLSVEQIEEVRRFMSTPTGSRFWSAAAIGYESLQRCYRRVLVLRPSDEDFRAVGLRPPRPRFRPGDIVS